VYRPSAGVERVFRRLSGSRNVTSASKGKSGYEQDIVLNLLRSATTMAHFEADKTSDGSPVYTGEGMQIAGEWAGRASPSFTGEPGRVFQKVARHAQGAMAFGKLDEAPRKTKFTAPFGATGANGT